MVAPLRPQNYWARKLISYVKFHEKMYLKKSHRNLKNHGVCWRGRVPWFLEKNSGGTILRPQNYWARKLKSYVKFHEKIDFKTFPPKFEKPRVVSWRGTVPWFLEKFSGGTPLKPQNYWAWKLKSYVKFHEKTDKRFSHRNLKNHRVYLEEGGSIDI